jgi:hypothetical protein
MRDPIPVYVHLRRAKDLIDRDFAEPLDVRALASTARASRAHFVRSFKRAFGETPHRYLQRRRIERAKELLRSTELSVTEVSLAVGFRPDHELVLVVPGPPMMDEEAAEQVKALVAKGALGGGAFETDDCRATYTTLSSRGVSFLSEPAERPWGIEATFRDNSGNWFSMTERAEKPVAK